MRELIERFGYRFQLWQKERYGDYSPPDPAVPRNPLRLIAAITVIGLALDILDPLLFHRAPGLLRIIGFPVSVVFLVLYFSKSKWAWHLAFGWIPFAFITYWILRLAGYSRYQPRSHTPTFEVIFELLYVAVCIGVLIWFRSIRARYFRYIDEARSRPT